MPPSLWKTLWITLGLGGTNRPRFFAGSSRQTGSSQRGTNRGRTEKPKLFPLVTAIFGFSLVRPTPEQGGGSSRFVPAYRRRGRDEPPQATKPNLSTRTPRRPQ